MSDLQVPILLGGLVGLCAVIAGFVTIFSKDMARRSEQWNRDFGTKLGGRSPEWLLKLYSPPIYRGFWLILFGSFFLWMTISEAHKVNGEEQSHISSDVSIKP